MSEPIAGQGRKLADALYARPMLLAERVAARREARRILSDIESMLKPSVRDASRLLAIESYVSDERDRLEREEVEDAQ